MKRILLSLCFFVFLSAATKAQFTVFPQNAFCFGTCTGSATIQPAGNYFYYWSNGDTGQVVQNLCPGPQSVIVYDSAFNSIDSVTFVIVQPQQILVNGTTTDATCFGIPNGTLQTFSTGGTPPYTYFWSNGSIGPVQNNLATGAYTLTLTDANGCSASGMYFINEPTPLFINDTTTDATACSACDGSVNLSGLGGISPYTYLWSNGATIPNINGLCQGTYVCTVTDANGCSDFRFANISAPSNGLTATATGTGIHCNDADTVTLAVNSGVAPYSVDWGDGANSSSGNSPFQLSYTQEGIYTIGVTDASGCTFFVPYTVHNFGVNVTIAALAQPSCASPNNGKLWATVTGGYAPFFYAWNTGATTDSIVNVSSGFYTVTVTDSLGCTATQVSTLTNSNSFYAYAYGNAASCDSGGLGSATIYVTGGTAPYTYLWSNAVTTQTATGIPAGNYGFTVTDNAGCSVANSANITFTSFSFYVYTSVDSSPNCGLNNGVVTAHPYSGASPYTYHWTDNQTTQTAFNLAPGAHSVTVTDAGGCVAYGYAYLQNTCYNTITGNIFNDNNSNCVLDSGDSHTNYATVYADNGTHTYYGYTDGLGNYSITVNDTGSFTVHASLYYSYQSCGNIVPCGLAALPVHFSNYNNTAININFGFVGSTGFDLYLHPGWTSANPGFPKDYWVYYGNQSAQSFSGAATVTFKYDSNLIYLSSAPPLPAHNVAAHTLTWIVSGVGNWDYRGQCHFTVPATVPAGYQLQSDFWITPTLGDCDSSNNHMHFSEPITSSMDPNEKEVSPAGNIQEEDSVLTYTIHFQNTGTDTTWFVIVKDTLSPNLDARTVRNLASSHEYSEFNISGEGILTWVFNPIYLVDSTTNEPASKGWLSFSIKKKSSLPIGSTISNKASIYFDYNVPVVTNTVADTLAEPNFIFEIRSVENISVNAVPNPFSSSTTISVDGLKEKFDFSLFDVTGRMLKKISSIETKQFELNRETLPAGVYFYKLSTNQKKVANGKLVVE